ncbi:MAG: YVTN family beta-propeller domain-containing protein, partial [Planctomycetota bacterium]|nr:YVTN family beta-propeller domain-containing protein [Planctomycetota bacterium]
MKRILAIVMFLPAMVVQVFGAAPALRVQHRRPAAAAMLQDGRVLCVANRRSGTLSLIDTVQWTVSEKQIGQELSDIVSLPDGNELLA